MRMLRSILLAVALAAGTVLSLSACSSVTGGLTGIVAAPAPVQEMQQAAFTARSVYAAALRFANEYAELPRCGGMAQVCSKQSVINLLRTYDTKADKATASAVAFARTTNPDATVLATLVRGAQEAADTFNSIASTVKGGA